MKKFRIAVLSAVILCAVLVIGGFCVYKYNISSVNNNEEVVAFEVEPGKSFLSISADLKKQKLIRSELFYKLYLKLHHVSGLEAGTYYVSQNMDIKELIEVLSGTSTNENVVSITFKEGINIRKLAQQLEEHTIHTEEDVYTLLKNEEYLNKLIEDYWFLTDEIKNNEIYYSLEGYLFPETYQFIKDDELENMLIKMLNQTNKVLTPYKNSIEASEYTVHELLTMASIIELEASNSSDREGVAGVFFNRLENNWSLGSDVTTYYAIKVDVSERDLYSKELKEFNAYNTRSSKMAGKLPVSPICNPGIESIKATINPTTHNYFYFVADKNKTTYFSKTYNEHTTTVAKLKSDGLWYEY